MADETRQQDDHIWITVNGEAWAIRAIRGNVLWLWRGYWPNLQYSAIEISNFDVEEYCDRAAKMLYASFQ